MTKRSRVFLLLLSLVLLSSLLPVPRGYAQEMAQEISDPSLIVEQKGFYKTHALFDSDTVNAINAGKNASMTLSHEGGIGSVYLVFDLEHGEFTVTNNDNGEKHTFGENNFLHEFLDLEGAFGTAPKSITIDFGENDALVNEMRVFTSGQVPETVQRWDVPKENEMDLLLFSTHGDDEQLFFAGILPYYGTELDYEVLVVFMTNHRNHTKVRVHEMLDGMWAVGIRNYPVIGTYPDYFARTLKDSYSMLKLKDVTEEDLISFVVENLRRYKPKVAVGHDPLGEYSHGQHMVYSDVLQKAVQKSMNPEDFPESAEKYGVWDVPKTYLHLYPENQIYMDWDQPLESFGGMSAFEVSKSIGFQCYKSQISDFSWYLSQGKTAAELRKYCPCEYGLFRSTVGEDVQKNDFFENLTTHQEDRLAAEEAARLEEERKAREEAEKQAQAEAAAAQLEEQKKQQEQQMLQKQEAEEAAAQKTNLVVLAGSGAAVLAAVVVLVLILSRKKHYRGKY